MCQSASSEGYRVDLIAPVRWDNPANHTGNVEVHRLRKYRRRLLRASLGTLHALRLAISIRASVYHLHDPELLPALLLLRFLNRRVVFDFHEEFSAQVRGKPYLSRRTRLFASHIARYWEFLLCGAASKILTATPRIRERLPVRRDAATVVCNYPSLEEFPAATRTPFDHRSRAAYYVGGVTEIRCCFELVEAARILQSSRRQITMRVAGPFDSTGLEQRVRDAAIGLDVAILGRRTRDQVMADLEDACVGLVLFRPHPNHCYAMPNKIFEYMAAGVPVVASNFPLWVQIVNRSGCGVTVDPLDPSSIASAIVQVVEDPNWAQEMGTRGRMAVERLYHWHSQWRVLRGLYSSMVR